MITKFKVIMNGAHYSIILQDEPCNFKTYDVNQDGAISKDELQALLGISGETDALFLDLDITTDDGVIKQDEFSAKAPSVITQCFELDK